MPLILPSNSISAGGFAVDNSLRFNGADNPKLSRTAPNTAPTNADKFTFSCWIKRSSVDEGSGFERQQIFDSNDETVGPNVQFQMYLTQNNLRIQTYNSSNQMELVTNRKFRDVSSWYSIIFIYDSSQSTASDRAKLYINGVQETSFSTETYPPQNTDGEFGIQNKIQMIGNNDANSRDFDGYMAEVIGVDGQALAHTDFGEFDEDTGIWKPINVSGIDVGNLGFYLDFQNSGALGTDVSGVGNFTLANLSSIDQSTDTCTNNYSTMNSLLIGGGVTMSEGNLSVAMDASAQFGAFSTIGVSTGKWYMEMKYTAQVGADRMMVGISGNPAKLREGSPIGGTSGYVGSNSEPTSYGYYSDGGNSYNNDVSSSYGDSWTVNDIIGIALDLDNNKLYFSKNGTFQNSGDPTSGATGTGAISITAPSSLTTGNYFFAVSDTSGVYGGTIANNFGSPSFTISSGNSDANGYGNFEYAVPSGYYALNTKNLSEFG